MYCANTVIPTRWTEKRKSKSPIFIPVQIAKFPSLLKPNRPDWFISSKRKKSSPLKTKKPSHLGWFFCLMNLFGCTDWLYCCYCFFHIQRTTTGVTFWRLYNSYCLNSVFVVVLKVFEPINNSIYIVCYRNNVCING